MKPVWLDQFKQQAYIECLVNDTNSINEFRDVVHLLADKSALMEDYMQGIVQKASL